MAGIYIHIPFCRQACVYCNFHFKTGNKGTDEMVQAIADEAALRKNEISEPIDTIYFGGGTPSFLSPAQLEKIVMALHNHYNLTSVKELTLEANPDDITFEKLQQWQSFGVNRLSIGVQSFNDADLKWMNRAHNTEQAYESIQQALELGFEISIDLIFGLPDSEEGQWLKNLEIANSLGVHHLSCYGLALEHNTAWEKLINRKTYQSPDEQATAKQFEMTMDFLDANGWDHYEISNYCRPGFEAKHNTAYWQNKPYIGLGPSAHSFNGNERLWNIADNAQYVESIVSGKLPLERERLTPQNKINEYLMTGLRTKWGIDLKVPASLGFDTNTIKVLLTNYALKGWLKSEGDVYTLTNAGKLYADAIASELFYSE